MSKHQQGGQVAPHRNKALLRRGPSLLFHLCVSLGGEDKKEKTVHLSKSFQREANSCFVCFFLTGGFRKFTFIFQKHNKCANSSICEINSSHTLKAQTSVDNGMRCKVN